MPDFPTGPPQDPNPPQDPLQDPNLPEDPDPPTGPQTVNAPDSPPEDPNAPSELDNELFIRKGAGTSVEYDQPDSDGKCMPKFLDRNSLKYNEATDSWSERQPDGFVLTYSCSNTSPPSAPHYLVQLGQQRPLFFSKTDSGINIVYSDGPPLFETRDPAISYVTRWYKNNGFVLRVHRYENGAYVGTQTGGVGPIGVPTRIVANQDYLDFMSCQFTSPPFGTFDLEQQRLGADGITSNQWFKSGLPDLKIHRGFDLGNSLVGIPTREFDQQNYYTNRQSDTNFNDVISGVEAEQSIYDIQFSATDSAGQLPSSGWQNGEVYRINGHLATHNSFGNPATEETYSFKATGSIAGPKQPTCLDQSIDFTTTRDITPGGIFVEGHGARWALMPLDGRGRPTPTNRYTARGPGLPTSYTSRLFNGPVPAVGDSIEIQLVLKGSQIKPIFIINNVTYNIRGAGNVEVEPPFRDFPTAITQNGPFSYGMVSGHAKITGWPVSSAVSSISYFGGLTGTTTWSEINYANYHHDYWNDPDAFVNPQNYLPNGTWRWKAGEQVKIYLQSRGIEPPFNITWNAADFPPNFNIDEYGTITGQALNAGQIGSATITVEGVQDTYNWQVV